MKKIGFILIVVIFLCSALFLVWKIKNKTGNQPQLAPVIINTDPMQITSPEFLNNKLIPSKYTCDGDGVNPPLSFADVPKQAVTLALVVDDPDASSFTSNSAKATSDFQNATEDKPKGTWVHWLVWNMAPTLESISENSVPQGVIQGQGSSGQNVYGSPCPPSGQHRYFFKLYALDTKLTIPSYSTSVDLEKAMEGHIISQAQLIGLYQKNP